MHPRFAYGAMNRSLPISERSAVRDCGSGEVMRSVRGLAAGLTAGKLAASIIRTDGKGGLSDQSLVGINVKRKEFPGQDTLAKDSNY